MAYQSRDLPSRAMLGAILPLHDVRYHACCGLEPGGRSDGCGNVFSTDELQTRLVEPDGIEPTTSCLQSRRSPN